MGLLIFSLQTNSLIFTQVRFKSSIFSSKQYNFLQMKLHHPYSFYSSVFVLFTFFLNAKCQNPEIENPEIEIMSVFYKVLDTNNVDRTMTIRRNDLSEDVCSFVNVNTTLSPTSFDFAPGNKNFTLFYGCPDIKEGMTCEINDTPNNGAYFIPEDDLSKNSNYAECHTNVIVPVHAVDVGKYMGQMFPQVKSVVEDILKKGFLVKYDASEYSSCLACEKDDKRCVYNTAHFVCKGKERPTHIGRNIAIGVALGGSFILTCIIFFIHHRSKKHQTSTSEKSISRNFSSNSNLKTDLERGGSKYFQTPIFSYSELEEATDNFDTKKEVGDGGFGTVYHGKLRDGRVVAVKRLYENNCKRVEQFMNEITILSRLRHQNLVTLYGCTSRHSRELLLVYEFIPNGTVADHLYGEHAKPGMLTWPARLGIAVECADALSYLHASDTIHRDVKSNNILLDNNFHVKVADFGLSRLFPNDVTHVSTAPQGTAGYVDPEYYQCYQLTDKSDVYSFGVVLCELISSKPAVDINRHRYEISLANMAINKVQNHLIHELVDPHMGYDSDYSVRKMVTLMAELAFRCLQQDKDMRPSMVKVLEVLKFIENQDYSTEQADEMDIPSEEFRLLKNIPPLSPDSVR